MKVEIEKIEYEKKKVIHKFELPSKQLFYFFGGIRKSYSVKPFFKFKENESDADEILSYTVVSVGRSFENIVKRFNISVHSIPDILKNSNHQAYRLVQAMIDEPNGNRTREQFANDLENSIQEFKNALNPKVNF